MTVGRYEVMAQSGPGRTVRGAVFTGLKWPSGRSSEADALGVLPPSVQLGSGSYDPIFGTVWTGQWLAFQVDADASYRRNTKANDFKFGDSLEQNVSLQYRLWPKTLDAEGLPSYRSCQSARCKSGTSMIDFFQTATTSCVRIRGCDFHRRLAHLDSWA